MINLRWKKRRAKPDVEVTDRGEVVGGSDEDETVQHQTSLEQSALCALRAKRAYGLILCRAHEVPTLFDGAVVAAAPSTAGASFTRFSSSSCNRTLHYDTRMIHVTAGFRVRVDALCSGNSRELVVVQKRRQPAGAACMRGDDNAHAIEGTLALSLF